MEEQGLIPSKVVLTFCQSCEEQIGNRFAVNGSRLCTTGCRWDGNTTNERPIIVVTYWRREMQPTLDTVVHGVKVKLPLE